MYLFILVFFAAYIILLPLLVFYLKRRRDWKRSENRKKDRALLHGTLADKKRLLQQEQEEKDNSLVAKIKATWWDARNNYPVITQMLAFASRVMVCFCLALTEHCLQSSFILGKEQIVKKVAISLFRNPLLLALLRPWYCTCF